MHVNLSLQQSPPFSVPVRFLISAPLFGLMAALVLLWYGPAAFSNRWSPEILAVTHFLTLGFLSMSMLGALMQLIPVLMGIVIPHAVLFSGLIHALLCLGCISLGLAWLLQFNQLFTAALLILGVTFSVFIVVTTERLLHSVNRHASRTMMMLALLSLVVTVGIGIYLSMGHNVRLSPLPLQQTDLHLSWGLMGWVVLLITAVAYQVIPMFQITDEFPVLHQRCMGWLIITCLLSLSLTYLWPLGNLKTAAGILLAGCLMIFSLTTLRVLYKRRRQVADPTLRFWQLAMICLFVLALAWSISTAINMQLPAIFSGILFIHGFAMTTINGMMYKIIPFIIWLHLSVHNKNLRNKGNRNSQVKVPHMRGIIPESHGMWQFRLNLISLALLLLATIWPWIYYPAVLLFSFSQGYLFHNLLKAVCFYRVKLNELSASIAING